MFIAALIVLTNSFFNVYDNPENDSIAQMAIYLHQHFAESDLLAARYLHILKSFQKTVADRRSMNGLLDTTNKDYTTKDPIEDFFSEKTHVPRNGHNQSITNNTILPADLSRNDDVPPMTKSTQIPAAWNWSTAMPQGNTSSNALHEMPTTAVPGAGLDMNVPGGTGTHSNEFSDNVEGLIFPGAEDLLGPDPGPILEEVIHFDMLWPLNQDTGLYSGNVPMYGMDNYL